VVCFLQSDLQGLHYIFNSTAVAESGSGALIRGGGCEGKDRWSWCNISDCSGSGCVVRGMISQRPRHEAKRPSGFLLGGPDPQQEWITSRAFPAQVAPFPEQARQLAPPDRLLLGPSPFARG